MSKEKLDKILLDRQLNPQFDAELWRFLERQFKTLRGISDEILRERHRNICESILWLVAEDSDAEPIESGHCSTWWWLRALTQTETEMTRRGLVADNPPEVPESIALVEECRSDRRSHARVWSRVSERRWLLDTLKTGMIRFSPAESYDNASLNAAQRDDELRRHRFSPGEAVRITTASGKIVTPIGDIRYTRQTTPYWISSWTLGVDLRLIPVFGEGRPEVDSVLVLWKPEEFGARIDQNVTKTLPGWRFADIPITYIDPHALIPDQQLTVSMTKDMSYAIQRELRLALNPPDQHVDVASFFLHIGSIEDIAGIYDTAGHKVAGSGPDRITT